MESFVQLLLLGTVAAGAGLDASPTALSQMEHDLCGIHSGPLLIAVATLPTRLARLLADAPVDPESFIFQHINWTILILVF